MVETEQDSVWAVPYSTALDFASPEAFGGLYESEMLATLVDESAVKTKAMRLIWDAAS